MVARALALTLLSAFAPLQDKGVPKPVDPSDAFFKKGEIPRLKLELAAEDVQKLRTNAREYVHCRVRENDKTVYENVSIKLKGSAGSFREIDDQPHDGDRLEFDPPDTEAADLDHAFERLRWTREQPS